MPPPGEEAARIKQLQALLGQTRQALATRESELRSALAQRELVRVQLKEKEARIRELEAARSAEAELSSRVAELERQLAESADARSRALELERGLAESTEKLEHSNTRLARQEEAARARISELEGELERLQKNATRVQELEAALERLSSASSPAAELLNPESREGADTGDDLKRIRGIGPAYERQLKLAGIRSYAQIAAWTDADLERIARRLKLKPERIRRDDWIESARALLEPSGPSEHS